LHCCVSMLVLSLHAHSTHAQLFILSVARYIKRAKAPGSQLVELPTVFVDAILNASAQGTGGAASLYETVTVYSCVVKLGVTVTELIIAGRTPAPPDASTVTRIVQLAKSQGAVWDESGFHTVNRTAECS
jgi:hypothetical protein